MSRNIAICWNTVKSVFCHRTFFRLSQKTVDNHHQLLWLSESAVAGIWSWSKDSSIRRHETLRERIIQRNLKQDLTNRLVNWRNGKCPKTLFNECARVLLGLTVQKKHFEYRRVNRSESSHCQCELYLRGDGFHHIFQAGKPSKTEKEAEKNAANAALTELEKMLGVCSEEASWRPTAVVATSTSSQHEERSAVEASTVQFFRAAFGI